MIADRVLPDWVFANKKGKILGRVPLENARAVAWMRPSYHESEFMTRHTNATIRLVRGHNVGDGSYQPGHSSIKMTYDVYTDWVPGHFKSEVDKLDEICPIAPQAQPEKDGIHNL